MGAGEGRQPSVGRELGRERAVLTEELTWTWGCSNRRSDNRVKSPRPAPAGFACDCPESGLQRRYAANWRRAGAALRSARCLFQKRCYDVFVSRPSGMFDACPPFLTACGENHPFMLPSVLEQSSA